MENGGIRRGGKEGECDKNNSTGSKGDFEGKGEVACKRHGRTRTRRMGWNDGFGGNERGANERGAKRDKRRRNESHACRCLTETADGKRSELEVERNGFSFRGMTLFSLGRETHGFRNGRSNA